MSGPVSARDLQSDETDAECCSVLPPADDLDRMGRKIQEAARALGIIGDETAAVEGLAELLRQSKPGRPGARDRALIVRVLRIAGALKALETFSAVEDAARAEMEQERQRTAELHAKARRRLDEIATEAEAEARRRVQSVHDELATERKRVASAWQELREAKVALETERRKLTEDDAPALELVAAVLERAGYGKDWNGQQKTAPPSVTASAIAFAASKYGKNPVSITFGKQDKEGTG